MEPRQTVPHRLTALPVPDGADHSNCRAARSPKIRLQTLLASSPSSVEAGIWAGEQRHPTFGDVGWYDGPPCGSNSLRITDPTMTPMLKLLKIDLKNCGG